MSFLEQAKAKAKEAKKAARELSSLAEANARAGFATAQGDYAAARGEPEDAADPELYLDLGEAAHQFPVLEGYLDKQKKKGSKLWQKRWFKLAAARLDYYKSPKDLQVKRA
jgi:hypothetical protein